MYAFTRFHRPLLSVPILETKVTVCTELDGKNLESGTHKYGFAFSYNDWAEWNFPAASSI